MSINSIPNEILYKILEETVFHPSSFGDPGKDLQILSRVNFIFKSICENIRATYCYGNALESLTTFSTNRKCPIKCLKFNLENEEEFNFITSTFSDLENLTIVEKENCNVLSRFSNIKKLVNLQNLKSLSIKPRAFFSDENSSVLSETCPDLKSLTIKKSDLSSLSFEGFHELSELETLNLKNCTLSEFDSLAQMTSGFPNLKELNLKGVGFLEDDDPVLDLRPLIDNLERLFPNLESLILDQGHWGNNDSFLDSKNSEGIAKDFKVTPFDSFPFLPHLKKFDLLNHYHMGLESVGRIENLHKIHELSIQCPVVEHEEFEYWGSEESRRNSFQTLNSFTNLQKLKLNFVTDRFLGNSTSCKFLSELENHPSLKEFTAFFGSFNYKQLEQIFHVAKGVNTITLEASEFILGSDDYEPNESIKTLRILNNEIQRVQDEYLSERDEDDQVVIGYSEKNKLFKDKIYSEEPVDYSEIDQILFHTDPMDVIELLKDLNLNRIIDIEWERERREVIDKVIEENMPLIEDQKGKIFGNKIPRNWFGESSVAQIQIRRVGTLINFFQFSKFAPCLHELVLSCPEEELEINAFEEIAALESLKILTLGYGTKQEKTYFGNEISAILDKYCREIYKNSSRIKRASASKVEEIDEMKSDKMEITEEAARISEEKAGDLSVADSKKNLVAGLKRVRESDINPVAKKRRP